MLVERGVLIIMGFDSIGARIDERLVNRSNRVDYLQDRVEGRQNFLEEKEDSGGVFFPNALDKRQERLDLINSRLENREEILESRIANRAEGNSDNMKLADG